MANRITGFDLPGRRLGGYSTQPPLSSLRKTALSAAEKRPWLGYRIGGDWLIMTTLTPRQAAAMAAERRLQDDLWCRSQSSYHAAENHVKKKIILGSSKPSENPTLALDPTSRKRSRDKDSSLSLYSPSNPKFFDLTMDTPSTSGSLSGDNRKLHSEETATWQCLSCTLLNKVSIQ